MDQKKQLKISLPIAFEYLVNIFMTLVDTIVLNSSYLAMERMNKIEKI